MLVNLAESKNFWAKNSETTPSSDIRHIVPNLFSTALPKNFRNFNIPPKNFNFASQMRFRIALL